MDAKHPWLIADTDGKNEIRNISEPAEGYPDHYTKLVKPGSGKCTNKKEKEL